MTPVDQQILNNPEQGAVGDCARAVIASLLDLPYGDVPHFAALCADTDDFYTRVQDFCLGHGFIVMYTPTNFTPVGFGSDGELYHLISGPSPRGSGVYHCVVGQSGMIHFDPHPSRAGLAGERSDWTFGFLIRA